MRNSLQKEIKKDFKEISLHKKIFSFNHQINLGTVIAISLISIGLYILLNIYSRNYYFPIFFVDGCYSNGLILEDLPNILIKVEVGLFSVFFSLVILITSHISASKSDESSFILIRKSYILTLILYNLFILFSFSFNETFWDSYLQIIPIFLNMIFITVSFYKTLKIMTNNQYFSNMKKELLLDEIKNINKMLIKERLAKNYKYSELNSLDLKIRYNPYFSNEYKIKSIKEGFIEDFKLLDFKKICKRIESIIPRKIKTTGKNINTITIDTIKINTCKTNAIEINICSSIGDQLSLGQTLLNVRCSEEVWNNIDYPHLGRDINNCFILSQKKHPQQKLKQIFLSLEDRLIHSIRNKNRNDINEIINHLIDIVESFQSLINYDYENAKKESNSIGGGWSLINYVLNLVRQSIIEAAEIDNIDILNSIISLPYKLMVLSIKKMDHYVFNELSILFRFLYHTSKKYPNTAVSPVLLSKSIELPKEISNLYISIQVKRSESEDLSSVFKFSTRLLRSQQDVIKMMIDNDEEIKTIEKSVKQFRKMFDSSYYGIRKSIKQVFYFMENSKDGDPIKENCSKIQIKKKSILFVLANYTHERGKTNFTKILISDLPRQIDYITYIFIQSNDFTLENDFGWSSWSNENTEVPPLDNNTSDFFLKYILNYVTSFSDTKRDFIFDKNLIYTIKNAENSLLKKLTIIEADNSNSSKSKKIEDAKEYFNGIISGAQNLERNKLIVESSLTETKISELKKSISDGYKHFGLKDLFARKKKIKKVKIIGDGKIDGGYNLLLDKELYVKNEHSHSVVMYVRHFGIGVKDFETQSIFQNWYNTKTICNISDLSQEKSSFDNLIALSTFCEISLLRKYLKENYKEPGDVKEKNPVANSSGYYHFKGKNIPIIDLSFRKETEFTNKLYLIDENKIGILFEQQFNDNSLKIEFIDLNTDDELRKNIIKDAPDCLNGIDDKDFYLRTKFVFKVLTSFKIESNDIILFEK